MNGVLAQGGTVLEKKKQEILAEARAFAYEVHHHDTTGHDWWHVARVTQLAQKIAAMEQADPFICELAALLHDVADEKLAGSEEAGLARVRHWLQEHGVEIHDIEHVMEIISTMSFKGGTNKKTMRTLEGQVVQDADRLDAMGAIGIARVMCYSGHKGRPIYDPDLPVREQMSLEEYRYGKDTAINHFYEKLLKLKDLMNTGYGKHLAIGRHKVMEEYLARFYDEWEGKA
jgi:uncharacterized protein